ncbi:histidine phosphatase family protein [Microterricola viridarii]|uniref:phosphoglycerate mutase (2,3-diphosphoglycerate-dependent) n=1 Tax=Microterricola viridarii TaxID=412690 RepID=A0A120I1D5_9MICO|nr:histidine phosphatase family protein [Microterricola viridarii]AMB59778.1 hypothetical protein AWU67_13940 [Microterricola viridarii]
MSPRATTGVSNSAPVTIYLTRHGETMLNALGRVQGWSDAPLTSKGRDVASQLGTGLAAAGVTFDAAHAADMIRHGETLALALEGLDFAGEVGRDARLREMAFGRFEGASNAEMWEAVAAEAAKANGGAAVDESAFDFKRGLEAMVRLNEGSGLVAETLAEVTDRAFAALTEIAENQLARGGGNVLVVSSGITIMAAIGAMGADLEKATGGIGNAAVAELQYSGGSWTVATFNDLSYVEAGKAAAEAAA